MAGDERYLLALAELRYLDQEAAAAYEEAVGAFPQDSDTARELHRFRADHARHAARIDDLFFGREGPSGLPEQVRAELQEQVWDVSQARGRPDELRSLLEAEEQHLRRYTETAEVEMPSRASDAVREGLAEEREHVERLRAMVSELPARRG